MPVRKIVHIDEELCDGCGKCIPDCVEGALQLIDGKARLVKEIYCDGLGACLGTCPQGAISIEERDAEAFDEEATRVHMENLPRKPSMEKNKEISTSGCPGVAARQLHPSETVAFPNQEATSRLGHWPVQLSLVSPGAPYFDGKELLLTADCGPVAIPDFHSQFLSGRAIAVSCPKLDDVTGHLARLSAIISAGDIKSIKILRMEVPCCSGLTRLAQAALQASGKDLRLEEVIIGIDGKIQASRDSKNRTQITNIQY
jgi:NAD-dependent dihydropyrimidine dehydrogenase PreA subunit